MKNRTMAFRTKLWLYFVLFASVIFSLLWVLQTVFLQSFYDSMMQRNIQKAAEQIAENVGSGDLLEIIDRLTVEDSLLVYLTDESGNVFYSSDSYKLYFRQMNRGIRDENPFRKIDDPIRQIGGMRGLPDNYEYFLRALNGSENGNILYTDEKTCVCGNIITLESGDSLILYVSGTLGAVGAAASIIRIQLLWVTALSLLLAFVIAWLIARRFSVPINQLTEEAKSLSQENYQNLFEGGFCRELDDLNDSLMQSAEKLSEARSYQKELLANVSHDLRTPLTMIKGYAEMLRDFSWEDEEQRNSDAEVIIKESDRLTALVNEILEYSRLEESNAEPGFTKVDLSAVTEDILTRFEPLFKEQGGTIERNIQPDCMVNGDAEYLERAVYNLIDNAISHSNGPEKRICVSVTGSDSTRLEVRDFGKGIAPEELPHIWDKYYTSRQRNHHGVSGLGLAIVKQIAVMHHADVSAESVLNEGSTFSITFPAAE